MSTTLDTPDPAQPVTRRDQAADVEYLPNPHPGEILKLEFLEPMGITAYRLAAAIGVGRMRISQILNGKRDITPDTAIRLGLFFGIEPEFWLNLQARYNLIEARRANGQEYANIERYQSAA